MANESFTERVSNIIKLNKLSQTEAAKLTGISQSTINKIIHNKVEKKFNDFDGIMQLCTTTNQKYYMATGEHLSTETHEKTLQEDLVGIIKSLKESLFLLSTEVSELRIELRQMREENKSAQVRLPSKIPEHH